MNKFEHDRNINYGMFSPKIENSRHLKLNKNKNNFENATYINSILGSPLNLYSHNKKKQNNSFFRALSPINRNNNKLLKSFSQRNIISKPTSHTSRILPSVNNQSFIRSPTNKRNINKKISYGNIYENFKNKQNYYNFETEKLYQETHQIKKIVKILTKQLSKLKNENLEKDKQISIKEKQINDIILNNNLTTFDNIKNNSNLNIKNKNYKNLNDTKEYYNYSLISSNTNNNELNSDSNIFNDSIYVNALNSNKNSSTGNLFLKIKKEIKQTNNEIKLENEKLEQFKKSIFVTTLNELEIESKLLKSQINKIDSLLSNALLIKEENVKKLNEKDILKEHLLNQEKIISNLILMTNNLENEENELKNNLKKNKIELKTIMKRVNQNNSKLDVLKKKNDNLTKEKNKKKETYTIKINGNPITFNSLYINKINDLKKSIKFYKRQIKFSESEIIKLKDKRKKIIEVEKKMPMKLNDISNVNNIPKKINQDDNFSYSKDSSNINEGKIISNLRDKLYESKDEEKKLYEKMIAYQNKLKEIDINKEEENESQIEFGIDNDNPYYIEDENNVPEKNNKFTSSQFNQFTYILFKNFESKGIILEESKNKLINPFIEFCNKNNLSKVQFPSNNFDLVSEEFTKIILKSLNSENTYNHIITKIFINALFFNAECDVNKLMEYFNILFSYTRNFSLEEEKYINKLKDKYKLQTEKLISCIKNYINNELKSSDYFPLLKMKEVLDHNEINLKDKYIEFLFYYMKKFEDPKAKLSDLKFSLLNNIISSNLCEIQNKENINSNLNENKNELNKIKIDKENYIINEENKNNISKKEESNILEEIGKISSKRSKIGVSGIKSSTEGDFSNKKKINLTEKNEKENSDDYEEDEDSMTEITNEEYVKQLTEALSIMQKGLKEANTNFNDLMANVIQKRKITGVFYECITIEDFNDQLKSIKIILSDLKLSCLCSKYSIPNELRLIDKNKIEKDIEEQLKGTLKFEEEENLNDDKDE
jgi:hypothetical protein